MDRDILLVRYQVQAANRRHFSALFFGVTVFSWVFALIVSVRLPPFPGGVGVIVTLGVGAFVAYRLLLRERACFEVMNAAWRELSGAEPAPHRGFRPGAMALVVTGQTVVALALAALMIVAPGHPLCY